MLLESVYVVHPLGFPRDTFREFINIISAEDDDNNNFSLIIIKHKYLNYYHYSYSYYYLLSMPP